MENVFTKGRMPMETERSDGRASEPALGEVRETPFEELYVQPAAGDGGGAVGAVSTPTTSSWASRAAS